MSRRSLVRNMSSEKQVQRATLTEKARAEALRNARARIASTEYGRMERLDFLDEICSCFKSIYDSDPVAMAYKAGKQDVGHRAMADMEDADPNWLALAMKERRQRDRQNEPIERMDSEPDTQTEGDE